MNSKHILAGALIAASISGPASAQVMIEMSEITCKQFAGYDGGAKDFVANWMRGYFSSKNNVSIVDVRDAKRRTAKVLAVCKKKPKLSLMEVIEKNAE